MDLRVFQKYLASNMRDIIRLIRYSKVENNNNEYYEIHYPYVTEPRTSGDVNRRFLFFQALPRFPFTYLPCKIVRQVRLHARGSIPTSNR